MKKFAFLLSCPAMTMQSFAQTPVTFRVTAAREKLLNRPIGYTTAGAYKDRLECGLSAWRLKTSN